MHNALLDGTYSMMTNIMVNFAERFFTEQVD